MRRRGSSAAVGIPGPGRLEGERVVLRDFAPGDGAAYLRAFSDDPDLAELLGYEQDPTRGSVRRMVRAEARARADGDAISLAIADRAQDAFLGLILLHSFSWRNRRADCGLFPAARRCGVGLEALRLLVGWAFGALGLNRVGLATLPGNDRTVALAERAGFQREGILRAYTYERGARIDSLVFGAVEGDPAWA